jgi:hypothetical protein
VRGLIANDAFVALDACVTLDFDGALTSAKGLDPEDLENYYRQRSLLKSAVMARHVALAVRH